MGIPIWKCYFLQLLYFDEKQVPVERLISERQRDCDKASKCKPGGGRLSVRPKVSVRCHLDHAGRVANGTLPKSGFGNVSAGHSDGGLVNLYRTRWLLLDSLG